MKKLLTIFVSIMLLFSLTSKAQSGDWAVSAQGGYSWLNGVVGGEFQYENFAFGMGWMPTTMPLTGDRVNSIGYQFTFYSGKYYESGYYVSIGQASAGYRAEYSSSWSSSSDTSPMTIVMGGYKGASKSFFYKIGLGYGWCDAANSWTGEIMVGIPLFTNY